MDFFQPERSGTVFRYYFLDKQHCCMRIFISMHGCSLIYIMKLFHMLLRHIPAEKNTYTSISIFLSRNVPELIEHDAYKVKTVLIANYNSNL